MHPDEIPNELELAELLRRAWRAALEADAHPDAMQRPHRALIWAAVHLLGDALGAEVEMTRPTVDYESLF